MHDTTHSKPLVLIAAKAHDELISRLQKAGYDIHYALPSDQTKWNQALAEATGIVIASGIRIDEDFLSSSPALRWIARLGSGMELIDMAAAEKRHIKVFSSPEGNATAVGEQALGMLLSLMHKITSSYREVSAGKWIREANRGLELSGKTVGIIGFGHTGQAFARVLKGFDVTILAHDKYVFGFGNDQIREASLEQVLQYSDVVSLHLPLTSETRHYGGASFFEQMEQKPYFINTSRGEVADTASLVRALDNGWVRGAALDVLENEQLDSYSLEEKKILEHLLSLPNVIITPHIAGYTHEAFYKMSLTIAQKLSL